MSFLHSWLWKQNGGQCDWASRGISILSCFGKFFTSIINYRLTNFINNNNILSENQAGFRPGYFTVDHIFTIKNVIDVFLSKKKKIFCAFIDFKKAFDTVWRSGLWSKLLTCGVTGNLLNVIKSIYNNIKSRIVANGAKSNYFSCYTGVRQGENLSPLLFSSFINDMESFFVDTGLNVLHLDDNVYDNLIKMLLMLYADDTAIFSNDAQGLQKGLDCLHLYCNIWKWSVNVKKTKIVLFGKSKWKGKQIFKYDGNIITVEDSFKYLGVILNYNGSFVKHKKHVIDQSQKATFALLSRSRQLDLPIDLQLELFDSLIMPILLYGCEIWGFENITMIEKIHLKYLKYMLGLKQSTPTCMVLGETGRYPLSISIKCRMISYWSKLLCHKESKLSNIMYKVIYQYNSHGVYTSRWLSELKNILDNTGHSFIWLSQILPENFSIVHAVKKSLQNQYVQEWNTIINNSSKCVLYRTFKRNFVFENYLTTLSPYNRKLFCKFRTINHKLPIEVGRYSGRPRFTRNCDKCDMEELGDEFHFLLQCPTLSDLRRTYLPIYCQNRPNIHKLLCPVMQFPLI